MKSLRKLIKSFATVTIAFLATILSMQASHARYHKNITLEIRLARVRQELKKMEQERGSAEDGDFKSQESLAQWPNWEDRQDWDNWSNQWQDWDNWSNI